jgi:hypothetical protein
VTATIGLEPSAAGEPLLQLHFVLTTPAPHQLYLPEAGSSPRRRDGLWEHTCLECFLGCAHQQAYWEFNLAPGGDWNVYRLEGYRQGLQEAAEYIRLPFESRIGTTGLELALSTPLPMELRGAAPLVGNVSAVIEATDGGLSYWAPRHGTHAPDFHERSLWIDQPVF